METLIIILVALTTIAIPALTEATAAASHLFAGTFRGRGAAEMTQKKNC
jgi:hypothetical protein